MRKEYGYFDKEKKALVITGNKQNDLWVCKAYYKTFKDGVHQEEIWFRSLPSTCEYGPLTQKEWESLWTLDAHDEYELDYTREESGWHKGFYYGFSHPEKRHSLVCFAKGILKNRELIIRSISVTEKEPY